MRVLTLVGVELAELLPLSMLESIHPHLIAKAKPHAKEWEKPLQDYIQFLQT